MNTIDILLSETEETGALNDQHVWVFFENGISFRI